MLTIIYLILILGVLVFVHEFGHFIAAKLTGVYVNEFALGMGPKIFSFKRKNKNDPTVYSLRLLPIGGFCAMAGEVDEDVKGLKKDQFMCNKTKWQRFLILIAGVTMNIILAFLLLFVQSLIWGHTEQKSIVGLIVEDSAAENSGLEVGDRITKVNGYKVNTWDKLTIVLNLKHDKDDYEFVVEKANGDVKTYNIVPNIEKNEDGSETKVFGIGTNGKVYKGILTSISYAFTKLGSIVMSMWVILINLFTGKLGISSLSGPVGMYSVVKSAQSAFSNIIYIAAYLSINLAVVNALPFPAFDGGRILFVVIEAIKGKKVDAKLENTFHTIGFILLMLLMVYITIQDIIRLF